MILIDRIPLAALCLAALPSAGLAQGLETSFHTRVTPAQHGGIFHVATGTWTRQVPQAVQLGPDIVYNNTANTAGLGGFTSGGIENQTASFAIVDAGRIPTSSSPTPGANRDHYNVNCIEISYCVGDDATASGPLNVDVQLYNMYSTCFDPQVGVSAGAFVGMGLPGYDPVATPAGYFDCWTVEFDLSGGAEICLDGDGDGFYSGRIASDQFGIGLEFDLGGTGGYVGAIIVGPLLAGDRDWTSTAAGGYGGTEAGGGGTYFGPAETCVPTAGGPNSSGFDQEDLWWTGERSATAQSAGCYWFGGYSNPNGCAANGTGPGHVLNTGLYALLRADTTTDCVQDGGSGVSFFCVPANANSTGEDAILSATDLASGVGSGVHLAVSDGPSGEFGYFLVGTAPEVLNPLPISNGLLCLSTAGGNGLGRYNFGVLTNSLGQFDAAGDFQNQSGTATSAGGFGFDIPLDNPIPGLPSITPGTTLHFQMWYRDTPAGMGQSNLSNGLTVRF